MTMKKIIIFGFLLFFVNCLFAQVFNGVDFDGESFTIDFSTIRSRNKNDNVNSGNKTTPSAPILIPTSKESQTKAFHDKAAEEFKKGAEAWKKRDWNEAIRAFKVACAYNPGNSQYNKALSDARGYKEWDKGVEEAKKNNWDEAIRRYKSALLSFPNETILKNNIFGCSYNQTLELAEKYYNDSDWINASVYYNVLWKNFENKSTTVLYRYSETQNKIKNMKKSEEGFVKFNSRLYKVKKGLLFLNNNW